MANLPHVPHQITEVFTSVRDGEAILLGKGERYTVSISGTFSATIQIQRRLPGQSTFQLVEAHTTPTDQDGIAAQRQELRLACTSFTSGSATGYLGK